MKFCCDRFKGYYYSDKIYDDGVLIKELYPNIRIGKMIKSEFLQGKNLYRYFFICGFIKDAPPVINIKYCPFCGTHLFDFYTSDIYINGEMPE